MTETFVKTKLPVCATCKHANTRERELSSPQATVFLSSGPSAYGVIGWTCGAAVDCVTGQPRWMACCRSERENQAGCGPLGRLWEASPEWLADMEKLES